MRVNEQLRKAIVMLNMHKRGKKMKALEHLDELLNEGTSPQLGLKDVDLILNGFEYKKGLLLAVGGENHYLKTLKNSAMYALRLLVKLTEQHPNKMDFLDVISTVDRITLEKMKLEKHFTLAENTRSDEVFRLCMAINQVKPTVPYEIYIKRQVYKERFVE